MAVQLENSVAINAYVAAFADPIGAIAPSPACCARWGDAPLPGTEAKLWHGRPVWLQDGVAVAGFRAPANFVTLMFWRGQRIVDASGTLSARGSADMASVEPRQAADVDAALFDDWLRQVRQLHAA